MITEQEQEFLERRKNLCGRCVKRSHCRTGKTHGYNTESCRFWEIKTPNGYINDDFRDAAKFEVKVQKWLMYQYENVFQCKEVSGGFMPSRETMLMFARIAVEEEMET